MNSANMSGMKYANDCFKTIISLIGMQQCAYTSHANNQQQVVEMIIFFE